MTCVTGEMRSSARSDDTNRSSSYASHISRVLSKIPTYFIQQVFRLAANVRVDDLYIGFKDRDGNILSDLPIGYGSTSEGQPQRRVAYYSQLPSGLVHTMSMQVKGYTLCLAAWYSYQQVISAWSSTSFGTLIFQMRYNVTPPFQSEGGAHDEQSAPPLGSPANQSSIG